jgi:hypothetical protein
MHPESRVKLNRLGPILLAGFLAACASSNQTKLETAATTPLNDLNLVQNPIPEVLAIAKKQAYSIPEDADCQILSAQIAALDDVLGPDLDTPATDKNPGVIERGGEAANDAAMGALQRTAEGVIPFRGWVRKFTGAERHSRQVAAAISAGSFAEPSSREFGLPATVPKDIRGLKPTATKAIRLSDSWRLAG